MIKGLRVHRQTKTKLVIKGLRVHGQTKTKSKVRPKKKFARGGASWGGASINNSGGRELQ